MRGTEEYWSDFSARFNPRLVEQVLTVEREAAVEQLLDGLMGTPQRITLIADSPEIATAFAVAAIRSAQTHVREFLEARTLIVDTEEAGRELVSKPNLVFLLRGEAARAPAPFTETGPTLVPIARWQRVASPGTLLLRQSNYAMAQALMAMNVPEGKANTLARGCGGSLSALERQMPGGACTEPPWMANARLLLPAFFAGAWDTANPLDREVVADLASATGYMAYDRQIRDFLQWSDAPLEREGTICKVVAPIDAFIHAGHLIGDDDLEALRPALQKVFGQLDPDPEPKLPVYLKERPARHSDWLRDGLATTLLLIAAWEQEARLSIAPGRGKAFANDVVGTLPGLGRDPRVLTSLKDELPLLAEAAPGPFLSALERMLEGTGAAIRPIFDEVEGFAFPTSNHTGVLWALETLAWLPAWFRRAGLALARLAAIDPGGRMANRPIESLRNILLPWRPSTFADFDARFALLDDLLAQLPEVGWHLLVQLLPGATTVTSGTARPRLRGSDAPPLPPLTYGDIWAAEHAVCQRAVALATGNPERMRELIAPMLRFAPNDRAAALAALDTTLGQSEPADRETLWTVLHDQVRQHRRFAGAEWALDDDMLAEVDRIADAHAPNDPVVSAGDLFDHWALENIGAEPAKLRANAVRALADQHGTPALLQLIRRARMWHLVLQALEDAALPAHAVADLVRRSFAEEPQGSTSRSLFGLYYRVGGAPAALGLAAELLNSGASATEIAGLFQAWPTEPATWSAAASLGGAVIESYWREFSAHWLEGERRTLLKLVLALIRRGRVLTALKSSLNRLQEIPTCLLLSILDRTVGEINAGGRSVLHNMLDYHMGEVFKALDARGLPDIEIGKREYALLPLLRHQERPLRLHRLMAQDPGMFHTILRDVYRAEHEPQVEDKASEQEQARARLAYQLLSEFPLVPGFVEGSDGDVDELSSWIGGLRALGKEHDRVEVTEISIGQVLAHAPVDDGDGGWPHRFVRDVIEASASSPLERGLMIERFNMRGTTIRGPLDGGDQERELAARYRRDAKTAQRSARTSAMLMAMAENWESDAEREDMKARQRRMRS